MTPGFTIGVHRNVVLRLSASFWQCGFAPWLRRRWAFGGDRVTEPLDQPTQPHPLHSEHQSRPISHSAPKRTSVPRSSKEASRAARSPPRAASWSWRRRPVRGLHPPRLRRRLTLVAPPLRRLRSHSPATAHAARAAHAPPRPTSFAISATSTAGTFRSQRVSRQHPSRLASPTATAAR